MSVSLSTKITITAPDDWHIHLRDGESLRFTVPHAAQNFERAIVMPNLVPPVTNAQHAMAYKQRIIDCIPVNETFDPLMVLYLTDNTSEQDIADAKQAGVIACKLYPAGATTNSDSGVTNIENIYPVLQAMERHGILLLVHGEVTDHDIDIFDREAVFIERTLKKVVKTFPKLKIVLEHITTCDAVDFVKEASDYVGATVTAHHLLFNRNHMLAGGIRPHYYCLPILKRDKHQQCLINAVISGNPKFFLGTDSAPHAKSKKEASCGCAGSYTAFAPLALYAEVFDKAGAMDKLENFSSHFGADFYGLPRNNNKISLVKSSWNVPDDYDFCGDKLIPIMAGEQLQWQLKKDVE